MIGVKYLPLEMIGEAKTYKVVDHQEERILSEKQA